MTGIQAKNLLAWYSEYIKLHYWSGREHLYPKSCSYLPDFCARAQRLDPVIEKDKLMRWLGFAQGVLHSEGIFTVENLRLHSSNIVKGMTSEALFKEPPK